MKNLKAMVMAAGMGSRLEPLTLLMPKPLIPVMNVPVMDIILENLKSIGIKDIISNTYYLSHKISEHYKQNNLGLNLNFIKENDLSGTAGGVKKCQFFFEEGDDFVVISGDLLTCADISKGIEIHRKSGVIATIGVKEIPKENVSQFGVVVANSQGYITEFQEKPSVELAKSNLINTGIYIFNYKIFDYIPENTFYDFAKNVFPRLLYENQINIFNVEGYWNDIGTLEQYKSSIKDIFNGLCPFKHDKIIRTQLGKYLNDGGYIAQSARLLGYNIIGKKCKIGEYARLRNCIVFDGAVVPPGQNISDMIILPKTTELSSVNLSEEKQKHILLV